MKPVDQRYVQDAAYPMGDCLAACVASIFLPHAHCPNPECGRPMAVGAPECSRCTALGLLSVSSGRTLRVSEIVSHKPPTLEEALEVLEGRDLVPDEMEDLEALNDETAAYYRCDAPRPCIQDHVEVQP